MKRKPQLGRMKQLDQGRRKKHHKPEDSEGEGRHFSEPEDADFRNFEAWLQEYLIPEGKPKISPSQSFSFKRFLQEAAPQPISLASKLRQLAIFWEYDCAQLPQPEGWNILKRVYEEALKYDPEWEIIYHSMSLSLRECAEQVKDEPLGTKMLREAVGYCESGIYLNPKAHELPTSLGRCWYELGEQEKALTAFEKAVDLHPQEQWAALYKAHCLHDLERWKEAAAAYDAVDLSFFRGARAWRGILLKDQMAECLLNDGQEAKALKLFETAITQYENQPGRLFSAYYLVRAATGKLRKPLAVRVQSLLIREDFPMPDEWDRGPEKKL